MALLWLERSDRALWVAFEDLVRVPVLCLRQIAIGDRCLCILNLRDASMYNYEVYLEDRILPHVKQTFHRYITVYWTVG